MAYTQSFGAIPSKIDIRDYVASVSVDIDLPEEFELEMCAVKNQGAVGSCVAYSISEVIEYFNKVQEGKYVKMSTGYIYGNRINTNYTGSGMYPSSALSNTVKYGDVPNSMFSYNVEVPEAIKKFAEQCFELSPDAVPNRLSSYFRLDTKEAIKVSLIKNGPVVFAMPWYSDISIKDGVIQHDPDSTSVRGHHCMVVYGWNETGWKIQNSWGTSWGHQGRAILPYYVKITEAYGVTDEISEKLHNQKLKELEKSNADYIERIKELNLALTSLQEVYVAKGKQLTEAQTLLDKIKKSIEEDDVLIGNLEKDKEALTAYIKEVQDAYSELKTIYDSNKEELENYTKIIEEQKKTIEILEQDLLDVKKPFKNWSKTIVKVINWIINLFKKRK